MVAIKLHLRAFSKNFTTLCPHVYIYFLISLNIVNNCNKEVNMYLINLIKSKFKWLRFWFLKLSKHGNFQLCLNSFQNSKCSCSSPILISLLQLWATFKLTKDMWAILWEFQLTLGPIILVKDRMVFGSVLKFLLIPILTSYLALYQI